MVFAVEVEFGFANSIHLLSVDFDKWASVLLCRHKVHPPIRQGLIAKIYRDCLRCYQNILNDYDRMIAQTKQEKIAVSFCNKHNRYGGEAMKIAPCRLARFTFFTI